MSRLKVRPTRAGEGARLTQIAPTEAASLNRWNDLPTLTSVNAVKGVKPGATVLLSGTDEKRRDAGGAGVPALRPRQGARVSVQDSWRWQMHASMPLEDMTHENYWRQLLRWLVDGVPDPVDVHTSADRVEPGEQVAVTADVVDDRSSS